MAEIISSEVVSEPVCLKFKQGKVKSLYWVDVGEAIDLSSIAMSSKGAFKVASDIKPRDENATMVSKFIVPPLLSTVNCQNFSFGEKDEFKCGQQASVSIYANGFIGVSYEFTQNDSNFEQVRKLADCLKNDGVLKRDSERIVTQQVRGIMPHIKNFHEATLLEDFVMIQINGIEGKCSELEKDRDVRRIFAGILCQDAQTRLSVQQIERTLSNFGNYSDEELIYIGFDVALLIGDDTTDEARLIEVVNLHRLEVRTLLESLDPEMDNLDNLIERCESNERIDRKSRRLLKQARLNVHKLTRRATAVEKSATNTLAKTEDQFLSIVYQAAANAFDLPELLTALGKDVDNLRSKGESIQETLQHQQAAKTEGTVKNLIWVEVLPTLCTWIFRLLILLGYGWYLTGPIMDKITSIFSHP